MVLPTLCGTGAMIYSLEVRTTLREEPQGQPQDVVEDVPYVVPVNFTDLA